MFTSSSKFVLTLCGACLPTVAIGQVAPEPDLEKSSEQIQCELNATCAPEPAAIAGADDEVAAADGADVSSETGSADDGEATRSWSWGQSATLPTRSAPAREGLQASNLASRASRPSAVSATRRIRPAPAPATNKTSVTIGYVQGSAAFTEAGQKQADKVYRALAVGDFAQRHYLVGGYTDSAGDATLNLDLSRRQAQALVDYLVSKGMPRDSFRVRGYGSADAKRSNPAGAGGRRVEITKLD